MSPAHAETAAAFQREVEAKWDEAALTERILLSQKRRRMILEAQKNGVPPRWNHGEEPGEKVIWYRGEQGYNEWAFDYLPEGAQAEPIS